ncbi:MAG: LuxR C-terminal-related transcriptional regulator [Anaerolineales bacterium]
MPIPVVTTKLRIPPLRTKVVIRQRLLERLKEGLSRTLTLVSAPAGFGKTTLLSEWLGEVNLKIAWLSLDDGDQDITRFTTYLISALQIIDPSIGESVLGALKSHQPPAVDTLLIALLNDIDSVSQDFVLVLDDYHEVDSKPVDEALRFLIEYMPPQMHLIIASREDPPLPLARLRAKGQLTELRAADLRFTTQEAADFLNQSMGLNLSAQDITALEARTEGWVAGLQLAALSMQGHDDITGFIQSFTGAHHFVLDYLLEEVLGRQSQEVQHFLLRTSILERLSGPLCEAVVGMPSQKMLEELERSNLFIVPLDKERIWYRYHHLFGDLLRQRLEQNVSPDEVKDLHLHASTWFEQNGDLAEAFRHAMASKDQNRAADIAERAWLGMDETFQSGQWLGWVKQLSGNVRRLRPVLCVQIAWAYMDASKADESESFLQEAEQCLRETPHTMVIVEEEQFKTLQARIAIARAYNTQTKGESLKTVKLAQEAVRLTPETNQFMRAQATAILAGAYWANGELTAAYDAMSHWAEQARLAGNFVFAIMTSFGLADILQAQGLLRNAMQTYEGALKFAAEIGVETAPYMAHHHVGLALLLNEMGASAIAEKHLQQSLDLGQASTIIDWSYRRNLALARFKESAGDLNAALYFLDEAQRTYVKTPIPLTHPIDAFKVRVYLKQGLLAKTQEWAQKFSMDDELSFLHEFEHITFARVLLAEKNFKSVSPFLERLLQAAENGTRIGSIIEILILQALTLHAQGQLTQALLPLKRAVTLAEAEGFVRIFDEGKPMQELLAKLSLTPEGKSHKSYIQTLSSLFDVQTPKPVQTQPLIDPLSERELEVLNLVALGLSNTEISEKLFLSLSTVKGHNLRIFNKLQAKSRTDAVARARELGLI